MQRKQLMLTWLQEVLKTSNFELEIASADASFRSYYRVINDAKSYIVMDAPPDKESLEPFVSLAKYFRNNGLNTPEIFAINQKLGFLLLSDFGNVAYLDVLNSDTVNSLYHKALDSIIVLQKIPGDNLPVYDAKLLKEEMQLFIDWYLVEHLHITLTDIDRVELLKVFDILSNSALAQPQVSVHRDYHSRNLMQLDSGEIGIIDFQDAVLGAITYDVVSLLKDCYIQWDDEQVYAWLRYYYDKIVADGIITDIPYDKFEHWFDFMGLQRHIKVAGIFARLNYRDGKPKYLQDIPLVLQYIRKVATKYSDMAILNKFCINDIGTTV